MKRQGRLCKCPGAVALALFPVTFEHLLNPHAVRMHSRQADTHIHQTRRDIKRFEIVIRLSPVSPGT